MIRIIGDPILQQPGIPFPPSPTPAEEQALGEQIGIAKELLIQSGGAGIAANQCQEIEKPFCFIIVGIFYEIEEHVRRVKERYPTTTFPQAVMMVNPHITKTSQATQIFNHACLSVPSRNRCAVKSPMEISINFQDPSDNMHTKKMTHKGIDAVVLWHELMHILEGKTYMDVTFGALSVQEAILFHHALEEELERRTKAAHPFKPVLTVPPFYYSVMIDQEDKPRLDEEAMFKVLAHTAEETLRGLLHQATSALMDRHKHNKD